jgi:hypothetical protein
MILVTPQASSRISAEYRGHEPGLSLKNKVVYLLFLKIFILSFKYFYTFTFVITSFTFIFNLLVYEKTSF